MGDLIAQPAFDRRRGDGSFVSLLFVVAVPLAIAVHAVTAAFIAPADTILNLVPKTAVAYVHASGRDAVGALLASSVDMPSDVLPDEVARFSVPGDDGLRHAIVVAWRAPRAPSEAEIAAIKDRGGLVIDERRAVFGDTALGLSVAVSSIIDASVANDPLRSAMLARMRSLHGIQGFAHAAIMPPEALAVAEDANGGPVPGIVFGATVRGRSLLARALPLDAGAASSAGTPVRVDLRDLGADVTVTEPSPSFDVVRVLFNGADIEHPSPESVVASEETLRELLTSPYAMWLGTGADGTASYLFRFPNVRPEEAKSAMAAHAAALEPSRTTVELPDGDVAVEYSVSPIPVSSGVAAFGGTDGGMTIYVGDDGHGGSLIGTSAVMFSAHLTARRLQVNPFCQTPSLLVMRSDAANAPQLQVLTGLFRDFGLSKLAVGKTVDNELRLCGYKLTTVDK